MVSRFGNEIRYCSTLGRWLIWKGGSWQQDSKGEIDGMAELTRQAIRREGNSRHSDEIKKWAVRLGNAGNLNGMVDVAKTIQRTVVTTTELDKDPLLFDCKNGTIDLRTGKLRAHRREDLLTKVSPVEYDGLAPCPTWKAFLDQILRDDQKVISYLQQILGYTLTGSVTEKALFIFWGPKDTGKTTLVEVFRYIMGQYEGSVDIKSLLHGASSTEQQQTTARTVGKRYVTASEVAKGKRLDEATMKQLTGMGKQIGKVLYKDIVDFQPEFKLFIDANHKPEVKDEAIWNRIHLVPFGVSIPKDKQDRHLREQLIAEAPGILAWAVEGCLAWQKAKGLFMPATVREAVTSYQEEMDPTERWINECCQREPGAKAVFSDLYSSYVDYCKHLELPTIPAEKAFAQQLDEKGFDRRRGTGGTAMRLGLVLKTPVT
jgi:putative DNA primase/helicase